MTSARRVLSAVVGFAVAAGLAVAAAASLRERLPAFAPGTWAARAEIVTIDAAERRRRVLGYEDAEVDAIARHARAGELVVLWCGQSPPSRALHAGLRQQARRLSSFVFPTVVMSCFGREALALLLDSDVAPRMFVLAQTGLDPDPHALDGLQLAEVERGEGFVLLRRDAP